MESSTREQAVDQHSPDLDPILIHYQGHIYELESGGITIDAAEDDLVYISAQGLWEDVTHVLEGEAAWESPAWHPTQEDIQAALTDPFDDNFMAEFEELLRKDICLHEKANSLVHKPRPRYGV